MSVVREIKRQARAAILPAICLMAIAYFGYHLVEGDRGLRAYGRLQAEIADTQAVLDEVVGQRKKLERRVNLMRADSLDADMLEEEARLVLGQARHDEFVVFTKE